MDGSSPISAAPVVNRWSIKPLAAGDNAPPRPIPEDSAYLLEMHSMVSRHQIKRDMRVLESEYGAKMIQGCYGM